jgi:hypothetical protein
MATTVDTPPYFKKYSSIDNHYNEKYISHIKSLLTKDNLKDVKWSVTEKIHGSNLSLIIYEQNQKIKILAANVRVY